MDHLRTLRRGLASSLIVIAMATVPIVTTANVASAAACGTPASNFDGTTIVNQMNYYAQANIQVQPATLCGNVNSMSSAWVMIASKNGNGGYTQAGYMFTPGNGARLFAQYSKNGSAYFGAFGVAISGTALYYDSYDFSAGDMVMDSDGYPLLTTPWDPVAEWTTPWVPQWEGETAFPGDNVPGSASTPAHFTSMEIKTTRGGGVSNPSGLSVSSTSTNYGVAWDTVNSSFHIWTK